ncbi:MAG: sulfotransferase [Gammaproteobacteria bacterium]|nr:sulfotransferase [Gammaproteobacteria bacterium]
MWSGPRNISTALMRAFGSRPDTAVSDEPLYAHYLCVTGVRHPGREEVLATQETDWRKVAAQLTGPIPGGRAIWYQKHMAHHLLPVIGRGWLDALTHAFLIREPDEMVASLLRAFPGAGFADTGLEQQCEIFDRVAQRLGRAPPVVLASDVLKDPAAQLAALCDALGIPFLPAMLAWPAGRRDTDGAWAPHWYAAVEASTGFEPYRRRHVELDEAAARLVDVCLPYYEKLYALRLKA